MLEALLSGVTDPEQLAELSKGKMRAKIPQLTDVIDLYQMHQPDPVTPIDETLGALNELVLEGKVRFLGSSQVDAKQIDEADRVARSCGFARYVSTQTHYKLRPSRGRGRDLADVRTPRGRAPAVLSAGSWVTHGKV